LTLSLILSFDRSRLLSNSISSSDLKTLYFAVGAAQDVLLPLKSSLIMSGTALILRRFSLDILDFERDQDQDELMVELNFF